ncbi:MAG TPA: hypothetical protein VL095_15870 [Flavisolibacter sp.]|nr:hypothetical protein [Flavisolibacter sp.]
MLFVQTSFAQKPNTDTFTLLKTYAGTIADVAMDNFDNLYIISATGQIKKLNAAGDSVGVYNQAKNYGKLYTIDVSNPLKLLLFYKDFSTVVILDRFLANQSTLDLKKFSVLNPSAIGNSYDNNIWVFDEYDNKLKKIDNQGTQLLETADFRTAFNQSISPQKIINDNGLVYLADTANGIFVFDNYGSFKRKIPVKNWQTIAIANNNIISATGELITVFNSSTQLQTQKRVPFFTPYLHSFITPSKLVNFSGNSIQVYQYRY